VYFSADFKIKQFLHGAHRDDLIRNQLWLSAFHPNEFSLLLSPALHSAYHESTLFEDIDAHRAQCASWDRFSQIDYLYLKHYMAEDILTKVDRASMYCALEVRSPFLATRLVEYAFSLPRNQKLKGFTTKYALKQLMMPYLGKDIVQRKKQGFAIPLAHWLAHDLRDMLFSYLNYDRIAKEGIFNPAYVEQLVREHEAKKADHRKRLWTLLIFEMWKERWGV
jgi:asparagine synthase (glutamine-hydrolysing)